MTRHVALPNNWQTRPYQDGLWRYLAGGGKRAVAVWHRRSGKDDIALNWTATAALERPATYWHMLPKANQARKAIWDAVDPHTGLRRIDQAFPFEIRDTTREQEMMIRFINGSTWQVVGSDNYNALVGSPPAGIVFSEYSLADPSSWDYLRPILNENGGWALFIYTPRGKNHGHDLAQIAARQEDWYYQRLTVEDTGVFSPEDIEAERESGMSDEMIQQEYYCSFDSANQGAYYGKQISAARQQNRIGRVAVEPGLDCQTFWDLGMGDSTAIWVAQAVGREIRLVHYYESSGEGLSHYANHLKDWAEMHSVRFSRHVMPHDVEVRELGTGKSRRDVAVSLGIRPVVVAPKVPVLDGIEASRRTLARCYFDEDACKRGIAALTEYGKDWDEKNRVWKDHPRHDWASHGADAFRMLAVSVREEKLKKAMPKTADYNEFAY